MTANAINELLLLLAEGRINYGRRGRRGGRSTRKGTVSRNNVGPLMEVLDEFVARRNRENLREHAMGLALRLKNAFEQCSPEEAAVVTASFLCGVPGRPTTLLELEQCVRNPYPQGEESQQGEGDDH